MATYLANQIKLGKIKLQDIKESHPEYYDEVKSILENEGVLGLLK